MLGCPGCVCNVNFRVEILGCCCPPHHKNTQYTCAASLLQEKGNRDQNRGIDVPVHAYVHGWAVLWMRLAPLLTRALGKTGNGAWCEVSTPMIAQSRSGLAHICIAPAFPPELFCPVAAVEALRWQFTPSVQPFVYWISYCFVYTGGSEKTLALLFICLLACVAGDRRAGFTSEHAAVRVSHPGFSSHSIQMQ